MAEEKALYQQIQEVSERKQEEAKLAKSEPQKTLAELKVEIKFHLGQMAGHAVEVGNLLIEAKEQVEHGEWYKWLENNFNLTAKMANNFMRVAERFGGNRNLSSDLNQTQLIALLALPEGEEENFIAEKAAEGTPVEDMTIKNLREEIKNYKEKLAEVTQERDGYKTANDLADQQLEHWSAEYEKIRQAREDEGRRYGEMIAENADLQDDKRELQDKVYDLQNKLLKQKTVEVAPADYEPTKKELVETKETVTKLQEELKELQDRPIDVAVEYPADYENIKSELAELKDRQVNYQAEYAVSRIINAILSDVPVLLNYSGLTEIVAGMAAKDEKFEEKILQFAALHNELRSSFEIWKEKQQANENV